MKGKLGEVLRQVRWASTSPEGHVNVLVALNSPEVSSETRAKLEAAGLEVDRVIKNKIIGSISSDKIDSLKALPEVEEVESSVRLEPHTP